MDEVIPKLINDQTNYILIVLLSPEEIKIVIFSLNKDNSPGPDGFRGFFFQYYWDVIKLDVTNAIT